MAAMAVADRIPALLADLSAEERTVLLMLSVLYVPTPVTGVIAALDACPASFRRRAWTTQDTRPVLESLQRRKLVDCKAGRYSCVASAVEIATRCAARDGILNALAAAVPPRAPCRGTTDVSWGRYRRPEEARAIDEAMRDLRIAVHLHDEKAFAQVVEKDWSPRLVHCDVHPYGQLCLTPFDAPWMDALPAPIRGAFIDELIRHGDADAMSPFLDWLEGRLIADERELRDEARCRLARRAIFAGRLEHAAGLLSPSQVPAAWAVRGFLEMVRGNPEISVQQYEKATTLLRKDRRKTETFHSDFALFHVPALLACRRFDEAGRVVETVASDKKHPLRSEYQVLKLAVCLAQGEVVEENRLPPFTGKNGVAGLLFAAVHAWRDPQRARALTADLERLYEEEKRCGRHWLAAEYAEVLARITGRPKWRDTSRSLHGAAGSKTILDAIAVLEPWERTLAALESFDGSAPACPAGSSQALRLCWLVGVHTFEGHVSVTLSPREQKRTATGWTGGRPVGLKRLLADWTRMDHLTDADRRICGCIATYRTNTGYYDDVEFGIETDKALPHLVGHPLVFRESDPDVRMEVVAARPVLQVERNGRDLIMRLDPPGSAEHEIDCTMEGERVLKIVSFSESDRRLARILGDGCRAPQSAEGRVREVLTTLATKVTVHADGVDSALEEVAADVRLHVHLSPLGEGLQGRVWVRPFGECGPLFPPGGGATTVMAEVGGRTLQARRSLAAEKAAWAALQAACSGLDALDNGWDLPDPTAALELLSGLETLGDTVTAHWPEGVRWRVVRSLEWRDLRLQVTGEKEWFLVGGDVPVDESRVLALSALLRARRHGRFVALDKGEFIALSLEMASRLSEIATVTEPHAKGWRVHPLMAPLLDEALDGAVTRADRKWRTHLDRLRNVEDAGVPSTLQADLRDYQVEGFRWLARLSQWGAGACLADDMGLGKTLQALALLLLRAADGPALVVAPTSVCANWISEAHRFAPTLRMRLYAGASRDIGQPGPFDVVVTSYALLAQDAAAITAIDWCTAVLDEAQAIKNASTHRSQAAMKLRAGFRMVATGTPIENHPGELWNLFRWLNPVLLGSRDQFEARFVVPMERGDRQARQHLKKLLSPFVLRRTKAQVLEELPPRTEITLHVELSETERGIYEALRRTALESLGGGKVDPQQRVRILAELMRLRRACCHPRLVLGGDDASVSSSKLDTFTTVLDELLDNHHKALVFSQFVDHLAVVRERLDARGIAYQYLDGSTSMKDREKRVAAFQRGDGDVFLISLRAGGTGLNLTAADYVIHLDPWWNPAVEDQASDRAHRIGQQRPVTIYRLVARDTVEERIVELHRRKRDLAESLLDGTEAAARMSADELLQLMGASRS